LAGVLLPWLVVKFPRRGDSAIVVGEARGSKLLGPVHGDAAAQIL
jgi:hypothetical protein